MTEKFSANNRVTLEYYQQASRRTYRDVGTNDPITYPTLGLCNETGELAGKIKKIFRDKEGKISEEDRQALKGELGDILWYFTQIATNLGLTLEEIAESNLIKIYSRLERGVIGGSGDNR